MRHARPVTILLLSLLSYSSFAQEYSYTHYDITEGLAGSTAYCITQDKDGFLWVGTETGVSRFDGTHFKNFTTADGLPDIEVLQIFGDSKGRVWMAPFRKSICYYYKGRIYNQDNDSLLSRIQLKGYVENFAEDAGGNVLIQEKTALHLVRANGLVSQYDSIGNKPVSESVGISRSASGHFLVQEGSKIWNFSGEGFSFFRSIEFSDILPNYIAMSADWLVWRENPDRCAIESLTSGQVSYLPFFRLNYKHISYSITSDGLVYFNEFTGSTQYDIHTGKKQVFLPDIQVSRTFRDQDGNLWFTTLGHGIFRLISDEFRIVKLQTGKDLQTSVLAISGLEHDLWLGNNHNRLFKLAEEDHQIVGVRAIAFTREARSRIFFTGKASDNRVVCASDRGLTTLSSQGHYISGYPVLLKSVSVKNSHELLLSAFWGAAIYNIESNRITDTIWHERCTAVYYHDSVTYVGTMNGLYRINPDKSVVFMGKNISFLRKRILSIAAYHDMLWVSSYDDAGVVGIREGKVEAVISKKQGLTSNICRTLLVHDNVLWIGTDKGLNKIELNKPGYPIHPYTSNDGLGSDMVNTIYADSNMMYVGTTAGLTYFDATRVNVSETCRLYLLSVINAGGNHLQDTSVLVLPYKKNEIRLEFAAISYRSLGNINYKYRLLGLDSAWKETDANYLDFFALPSGNYQFQMQAINKFGTRSNLLSFPFLIITPFWKTIWFYATLLALFLYLVWLAASQRIKRIRRRQEEKEQLRRRMFELEHQALQAQMNPHFIFNCLNSIQQYIFRQDIPTANKYISGLAKLIRAILNNSTLPFISLTEEVEFLSNYLSLEKLRFKNKMTYEVVLDPGIDKNVVVIPPMILQPYVENSMRHGLRHKSGENGHIRIEIKKQGDHLSIVIEDNGIGRKKAALYKTAEHIEYQSRGMSVTADRIRIMNAAYDKDIRVQVTDLEDDTGRPAGTRVAIQFTLFETTPKKEHL